MIKGYTDTEFNFLIGKSTSRRLKRRYIVPGGNEGPSLSAFKQDLDQCPVAENYAEF